MKTYTQLSFLDAVESEKKSIAGMNKAVAHANQVNEGWEQKAREFIINKFLPLHKRFMTEELRAFATENGFEMPPHARAWGGIIKGIANDFLIISLGFQKVKNTKAHRTPATLWERNDERLF